MTSPPAQLAATYFGFIETTQDALILFEACLSGRLNHVARRPHDREREHVIKSGQIFVYEEHSSGIKRWTDGISWSPSRILGNFLIYRQLVRAFASGEKKKALKKPKGVPSGVQKSQSNSRNNSIYAEMPQPNIPPPVAGPGMSQTFAHLGISLERERQLIGSLTDSYDFMEDGLVKKTISVEVAGSTHHLVSYYTVEDAAFFTKLMRPSKDPKLASMRPRPDLLNNQHFRCPIEDDVDPSTGFSQNRYDSAHHSHAIGNHLSLMSGPGGHPGYTSTAMYSQSYDMPSTSAPYPNGSQAYSSNNSYGQYAASPGMYNGAQRNDASSNGYRRFSNGSVLNVNVSHAQMPGAASAFNNRRSVAYSPMGSEEAAAGPPDAVRFPNGDSWNSQGQVNGYYNRDITHTNNAPLTAVVPHGQRLPDPPQTNYSRQTPYDRTATSAFPTGIDSRENAGGWALNGNSGVNHAHYQQRSQWGTASATST